MTEFDTDKPKSVGKLNKSIFEIDNHECDTDNAKLFRSYAEVRKLKLLIKFRSMNTIVNFTY